MSRILITDDDAQIRTLLKRLLEIRGHVVIVAADGCEGLQRIRDGALDLVVLDLVMPCMDGLETIKAMRAEDISVPVIVMSGGARSNGTNLLPAALELGALRAIGKPFSNKDFVSAVENVLTRGN
jgi:two-component system response regulator MprA